LCDDCHKKEHLGRLSFWSRVLHLCSPGDNVDNRKEIINGYLAKQCLKYANEFFSRLL
jgi:hypothetical protein